MRLRNCFGWACVLALLAATAPAGTTELREPGGAFSISVPQDWTQTVRPGLVQAQDPKGGIRIEASASPRKEQSLDDYAAWCVRVSQKEQPNWKEAGRKPVTVSGLPGILIQATFTGQGGEVHEGNCLVLAPDRQLLLIVHCPLADHEANKAAIQEIAGSWRIAAAGAASLPPAVPLGAGQQVAAPQPQPQPFPQPQPQPQPFPQPFPGAQPGAGGMKELSEPGGLFSISVPANWMGQAAQSMAMAADPSGKASLMLMALPKMGPTQQVIDAALQTQKQQFPGWTPIGQETTQVAGKPAMHIRAEAQVMNVPTVGDYYFVEGDQAIFVLVLSCAKELAAQYQGTFQQIQASLRLGAGAPQAAAPGQFPQPQQPQFQPQPPQFQPQPPQFQPQPPQFQPQPPQFQPQPPQFQPQPPQFQPQPPQFQPQPPGAGGMKQVTDPGGAFSISVPGDWQVQQQAGAAGAMEPTGRLGVGVMALPKMVQSADQFAQAMVATARQNMPGWQQVGSAPLQVAGRQAVHVRATAQVMNNPVVIDYIFLLTDTRQVAVVFTCAAQEAVQRQAQINQILQTLQVQ